MGKISREFYLGDTLEIGKQLLGKIIVSDIRGKKVKARIVETECYIGPNDKAAHSYGGKKKGRCEIQYKDGGYAYIYLIYGMYCCFNIVTGGKDKPECVLIRAAEPIEDIETMKERRKNENIKKLLNGPGKFCQGMGIDRSMYGEDLCGDRLYIEDDGCIINKKDIEASERINIAYAQEAKYYLWRFSIRNNEFVSVKTK